jgi:bacillithiol biosynthesis deacetylase BshB1
MKLDILAIAPHPDDVELHCSGLMLKMVHRGYKTGIVDLTRGEMGTRGTVEERNKEASASAKILQSQVRINLDLPDSQIGCERSHVIEVIKSIRTYQPDTLLIPHDVARHPDHSNASSVASQAAFLAGLDKIDTNQPAFRPKQVIYYFTHYTYRDLNPSFIVDISPYFEKKMDAVKAFKSQFFNPNANSEPATYISRPEFLSEIDAQNRYYGSLIDVQYGEPYIIREYLAIDDPVAYFK